MTIESLTVADLLALAAQRLEQHAGQPHATHQGLAALVKVREAQAALGRQPEDQ